jgi:hypothetical protein
VLIPQVVVWNDNIIHKQEDLEETVVEADSGHKTHSIDTFFIRLNVFLDIFMCKKLHKIFISEKWQHLYSSCTTYWDNLLLSLRIIINIVSSWVRHFHSQSIFMKLVKLKQCSMAILTAWLSKQHSLCTLVSPIKFSPLLSKWHLRLRELLHLKFFFNIFSELYF